MAEDEGYPKCFGPYLRYAIATDFKNFQLFYEQNINFFDEKTFRLFLLVELKQAELVGVFEDKMIHHSLNDEFRAEFGPDVGHTRYATMRCRKAAVLDPSALHLWRKYVSRVELSLPVKPTSIEAQIMKGATIDRSQQGKYPPRPLLIGMLDDGCPFAAAQFLNTSGNAGPLTRVLAIWDQNQGKPPVDVYDKSSNLCQFGRPPPDFTYGLEFRRDFAAPVGSPRQMGLDEWIQLHSTPAGIIDEDGCYADGGFESLMRSESHGAHVMDVFAGRIPTSSRLGPSPPGDRRDPPSWKLATDPASSADLVFVQFSDDSIRDATGVWLKDYVVQGIQYILSFADPIKTEKVIINLSYGPTTGPHDGSAELEAALSALVAEYNGTDHNGTTPMRPKLEIVLAAGNSYLTEGHVVFTSDSEDPEHVEWTWRLAPDNTVLCFAEVWMDNADAGGVTVTLTSPSGLISKSTTGPMPPPNGVPGPSYTGVYAPLAWGNSTVWLLAVEPTIAASGFVPEHGDYTIKVEGIPEDAEVHAYVARSDPNMGVRTGAKRSYFVDPQWEQTRSAQASCTHLDGEFDTTGSLIHRDGTLNGIATAKKHRVHVAGGYILSNGRKSTYSSEGPARRGPRVGPDVVLPCDESYALEGILAGGNRSGAVFRLTGTSTAAPQLARRVTNPPIPSPNDIPTTLEEIRKRGGGDLDPP
jgi:hypothetical protein